VTEGEGPSFTVVVCTRDRPGRVRRTLEALREQTRNHFPVVVVDQSDPADSGLAGDAAGESSLRVVHDDGRGLSRARNIGARTAETDWVVFLDDDCVPERDWAERLEEELVRHPEADMVACHVEPGSPPGDYVPASAFPVTRPALRRGRFRHPGHLGLGVCMAVRSSAIQRLGGWDERLGAGVARFPAAEDMDFNYRLLRGGGAGFVSPAPRARHEQWRSQGELQSLLRGYMRGWGGFAAKHLRTGDPLGGIWLWTIGAIDVLDMLDDALRRRSRLRLRLAGAKLRGLLEGSAAGLRQRW
jgi:GT2 family glycosyltransferase